MIQWIIKHKNSSVKKCCVIKILCMCIYMFILSNVYIIKKEKSNIRFKVFCIFETFLYILKGWRSAWPKLDKNIFFSLYIFIDHISMIFANFVHKSYIYDFFAHLFHSNYNFRMWINNCIYKLWFWPASELSLQCNLFNIGYFYRVGNFECD